MAETLSVHGGIEALLASETSTDDKVVTEDKQEEQNEDTSDVDLADAQHEQEEDDSDDAGEEAQAESDDENSEDADVDSGDEEEELITVRVDGVDHEVTFDELVKGYNLTSVAGKRMEEAAEMRKEADARAQAAAQERTQYAERLATLDQLLSNGKSEIPPELWDEDPIEASRLKAQNDQIEAKQAQVQAERESLAKAHLAEQHRLLTVHIPEWKNADLQKKERAEIFNWAKDQGFSDQEISAAADARLVKVLRKAMLFDRTGDKVEIAKKKVKKVPKMSRGKTRRAKGNAAAERSRNAEAKLNKSGKAVDAVDLLLARQQT